MSTLYERMLANQYYPPGIQRVIIDDLADLGIPIVDGTNPVVFTLKSAAQLVSIAMEKYETVSRKQYASLSQTESDLYYHMSDDDYINRFAKPSTANILVAFDKAELLNKLVEDPTTGIKKLVIPRNTSFTVSDTTFSLQYPIEIQQLRHGGLSIVYNTDTLANDYLLSTNIVEYYESTVNGTEWLTLNVFVHQFRIMSVKETISAATPVAVSVVIADSFYCARVYLEQSDSSWLEIKTTHNALVYDVLTPTAVLTVVDSVLYVTIPQIYISAGLALSAIRVDMYETKGDLTMDLSAYPSDSFTIAWQNVDSRDDTVYTAPMKNIQTVRIMSADITTGGRAKLTFLELRDRVINHTVGPQTLPITPSQIETALVDDGYAIVKHVDTLTDRVFLAVRSLPTPTNAKLITAAAIGVQDILTSFKEATLLDTVIDNGTSITITPDTIYQITGGVTSFLSSAKKASILQLPADKRAVAVTSGNYYYSPFHYVLDTLNNEFDVRPYYLTNPQVAYKNFILENDTTELQVSISAVMLTKTATGYLLQLNTASSADFHNLPDSDVYVQLSYIPAGEKTRAVINGVLSGTTDTGERLYSFELTSNHYVNKDDLLQLSPFSMFDGVPQATYTALNNDFDVVFSTSADMPTTWVPNSVDTYLGLDLLPKKIAGITHEKVHLKFGDALDSLWAQARTVASSLDYETYPETIYEQYLTDEYERDPVTNSAIKIVDGKVTYKILHAAGEYRLDSEGNRIVKHIQGDTIISSVTGNPIIKNQRAVSRQFALALVEGAYYFANDSVAVAYRDEINNTLVNWIVGDLNAIDAQLLEKTNIYFYPKSTLGQIQAMVDNSRIVRMNAGQSFTLSFYVSKEVFEDARLREKLESKTIEVISNQLKEATISMTSIIDALRTEYGDDVIEFNITGLEDNTYRVASMVSDATRCSIKKRLTAQGDSSLIVEEAITFNYYKHSLT